jgi:stage II sporulation protein D (peptidoglycan lytic transglycosylase)
VRFVPAPGSVLGIAGGGRYRGVIEVGTDGPGTMGAVNELGLEEYVAGVAEMPSSWSMAALEAQAVAARTYVLWQSAHPGSGARPVLRYDICATSQCQVYSGLAKEEEPGARWRQAVDATAGQILADSAGHPILARYFSQAGGRTRFNEDVFIGEGSYPYLVAVDTPEEDGVAPLSRWQVVVPPDRLARILDDAGEIRPRGSLTGVEVRTPGEGSGMPRQVAVKGTGGERIVRAATFARAFSEAAEKMFPAEYPGMLPVTFPSSWFSLHLGPEGLTVDGRGYGHGVGMSQYGAHALSDRGMGSSSILAHYYGGLRPTKLASTAPVRVGVAEGAAQLSVTVSGSARLTDARGHTLAPSISSPVMLASRSDGALSIDVAAVSRWVSGLDLSVAPGLGPAEAMEGRLPLASVVTSEKRSVSLSATNVAGNVVRGPEVDIGPGRGNVPLPALPEGAWTIGVTDAPLAGSLSLHVVARLSDARSGLPGGAGGAGAARSVGGTRALIPLGSGLAVVALALFFTLWRRHKR